MMKKKVTRKAPARYPPDKKLIYHLEAELTKANQTIRQFREAGLPHICNECNAARIDELRGVIKQLEAEKENWIKQLTAAKQLADDNYQDLRTAQNALMLPAEFKRLLKKFIES